MCFLFVRIVITFDRSLDIYLQNLMLRDKLFQRPHVFRPIADFYKDCNYFFFGLTTFDATRTLKLHFSSSFSLKDLLIQLSRVPCRNERATPLVCSAGPDRRAVCFVSLIAEQLSGGPLLCIFSFSSSSSSSSFSISRLPSNGVSSSIAWVFFFPFFPLLVCFFVFIFFHRVRRFSSLLCREPGESTPFYL